MNSIFKLKHFQIVQNQKVHKVGTDAFILGALLKLESPKQILDVGCGTGILSLICAQKFSEAQIHAIDICKESIEICKLNFNQSLWTERLDCLETSFLNYSTELKFDCIISNPPFYIENTLSPLASRVQQRNSISLDLRAFLNQSKKLLHQDGIIWLIIPSTRSNELKKITQQIDLSISHEIVVNGQPEKPNRVVFGLRNQKIIRRRIKELTIRDSNGNYTNQYKVLTMELHDRKI
jgi:tRNA1Val (adenine37-N6)-methyltransferase